MAAGTAAALVPIKSITMRSKGDKIEYIKSDEPGPICIKLIDTLQGIQRGKIEDSFGWLDKIEEAKGYKVRGASDTTSGTKDNVDKLP